MSRVTQRNPLKIRWPNFFFHLAGQPFVQGVVAQQRAAPWKFWEPNAGQLPHLFTTSLSAIKLCVICVVMNLYLELDTANNPIVSCITPFAVAYCWNSCQRLKGTVYRIKVRYRWINWPREFRCIPLTLNWAASFSRCSYRQLLGLDLFETEQLIEVDIFSPIERSKVHKRVSLLIDCHCSLALALSLYCSREDGSEVVERFDSARQEEGADLAWRGRASGAAEEGEAHELLIYSRGSGADNNVDLYVACGWY